MAEITFHKTLDALNELNTSVWDIQPGQASMYLCNGTLIGVEITEYRYMEYWTFYHRATDSWHKVKWNDVDQVVHPLPR